MLSARAASAPASPRAGRHPADLISYLVGDVGFVCLLFAFVGACFVANLFAFVGACLVANLFASQDNANYVNPFIDSYVLTVCLLFFLLVHVQFLCGLSFF